MDSNKIKVTRKTTESEITVTIESGTIAPDYRKKIRTPLPFLNHMIEHIVWRSGLNIEIDMRLADFDLSHVVAEDAGMTLGKAIARYNEENLPTGFGDAIGIIDEAKAEAAFSFESRTLFDFTSAAAIPEFVEGMASEDVLTFLDGLAQGANCTLHLDITKGKNAHHIFEAAYRAVGTALGRALYIDEKRKNQTAGVAGAVRYEFE